MSFFSNLFASKPKTPQTNTAALAEDRVLELLLSFIRDKDVLVREQNKFYQARNLAGRDRDSAYLQLYFDLENFLTTSKPPLVDKEYTTETLRKLAAAAVPASTLKTYFKAVFAPSAEQSLLLAQLGVSEIAEYVQLHVGTERLEHLLRTATVGTILRSVTVNDAGIDFNGLARVTPNFTQKNLLQSFKQLYQILLDEIKATQGEKAQNFALHTVYDFINRSYSTEFTIKFLEGLPDGVMEQERLAHLSRADLEHEAAGALAAEREKRQQAEKLLTESQSLQKALQEERDRVSIIINSIGEGVIVTDQNLFVSLINPAAREILEIPASAKPGELGSLFRITQTSNKTEIPLKDIAQAVLVEGKLITIGLQDNISFTTSAGKSLPVEATLAPLTGGRVQGIVIVFRVLSAENTAITPLLAKELREAVVELNKDVEKLEHLDLPKPGEEAVSAIGKEAERIIAMTGQYAVPIPKPATPPAVPTPIDFKDLTERLWKDFAEQAKARPVSLDLLSNPEPLPKVTLEPVGASQVVGNILLNAIQYSKPGGTVEVTISLVDNAILYEVRDHGIGIPKAEQAKVFEKFYRGSNAKALMPDSSGLGLYQVRTIVESWGGKVWVASQEGKGTLVSFTVPLKDTRKKAGPAQ